MGKSAPTVSQFELCLLFFTYTFIQKDNLLNLI